MSKKPTTHTASKAKREYNNAGRAKKSEGTQKLILETFINLLVERRGGDVHIEEIAKRCAVSERTIFRFFKDKEALFEATNQHLMTYLKSSVEQMETLSVSGFAKKAFELFEKNQNLMMAYLYSPFGRQTRTIFRKQLNEIIISQIRSTSETTDSKKTDVRMALIASLVNANIWHDIKMDFNYKGDETGEAVQWAIETLISNLKKP